MMEFAYHSSPLFTRQPTISSMSYPPTWIIRFLKTGVVVLPLMVLVFGLLLLISQDSRTVHIPTTPASYEDYVQQKGLCNNQLLGTQPNRTNETAVNIHQACQELQMKEVEYYSQKKEKIHPFNYTYLISGENICDNDTEVVLIIHAYQPFYQRRKAIRETWGGAILRNTWPNRIIDMRVKIVFIFGSYPNHSKNGLVRQESHIYSDIVQGNFHDSYNNMTLKSLMGLKWVSEHCPSARYLVKSDDDMIINFPYLLFVLRQSNMTWSIMGPLNTGAKVYRKSSKWAISKEMYPFFYYPQYESGSTYIISSDLVKPLFETAQYVPRIFIDDVYITGILGKILKIRHKRQTGFAYWVNKTPKACDIIEDRVLTGTRMKPETQYSIWKAIWENKCP